MAIVYDCIIAITSLASRTCHYSYILFVGGSDSIGSDSSGSDSTVTALIRVVVAVVVVSVVVVAILDAVIICRRRRFAATINLKIIFHKKN